MSGLKHRDVMSDVRSGRDAQTADRTVSLSLISTEDVRPVNPKDPKKGNKPLVGDQGAVIPPGADSAVLKVAAPLDVAEGEIAFVVRADARTHGRTEFLSTLLSEPVLIFLSKAINNKKNKGIYQIKTV